MRKLIVLGACWNLGFCMDCAHIANQHCVCAQEDALCNAKFHHLHQPEMYCTCQPILYCAQGLKEIACMPNPQISSVIIVTIFLTTQLVMVEIELELASLLRISCSNRLKGDACGYVRVGFLVN
jgi:hypothetical protein